MPRTGGSPNTVPGPFLCLQRASSRDWPPTALGKHEDDILRWAWVYPLSDNFVSSQDRLIFGVCFAVLYPVLMVLMLGLLPYSDLTGMMLMTAVLPAALLGSSRRCAMLTPPGSEGGRGLEKRRPHESVIAPAQGRHNAVQKKPNPLKQMARARGLEPAASGVTGLEIGNNFKRILEALLA
jgi:hypothetical protein